MARKASKESEAARVAFEKSVAKGAPLTPIQMAARFDISVSTIYRRPWYKNYMKEKAE